MTILNDCLSIGGMNCDLRLSLAIFKLISAYYLLALIFDRDIALWHPILEITL